MDFKTLLSKDCRIIIDTCSMMNTQFGYAMQKIVPVLEKSGNKLIVPESCVNELRKHSRTTKLSAKAINAATALNVLRVNDNYISIKGDQSDSSHADNVILRVCNQFRTRYYLIVITEDKDLRADICDVNEQKSVFGNKIEVVNIDYIVNYKVKNHKAFSIQTKISEIPETIIKLNNVPEENSKLITNDGFEIYLKNKIKAGGEGTVYETNTYYVAKIYHQNKLSTIKKKKIDLLVNAGLVIDGVCLPEKSLFNDQGEFVGYLMKKATGKSLDCSFFKGERGIRRYFPNWTRTDLVDLCITILSKIKELHRYGLIIGDLNGANILVNTPSSVFIVDTDSFQINDLPCPVGTEVFTAPEIQGKDYKAFLRTKGNENFAVATLLFKLLMFGIDPYAQKGGESITHNIKSGNFSFPFREESNGKIPDGDWKFFWSHLFFPLKERFYSTFKSSERYFSEEDRPDVVDWLKLLKQYKSQLIDGTIAGYDENSLEMFPKQYKKIPNETYLECSLCKQEVPSSLVYNPKSSKGVYYCWNCLHKSTIIHCESCGAQMEYTTYRKLIDNIPPPKYCKSCKDKFRMEKKEKEEMAEIYRNNVFQKITCNCCGVKFNITNGEKDYLERKGLVLPKRCPECRRQGRRPDYSEYEHNRNSSSNQSSGSSGCFITTAVCDFYGKADDCYELMTLREFRDNWLAKQSDGMHLIQEYYLNAPGLVEAMKTSRRYEHYCMILMNDYINPCVSLINQERYEECKKTYISGIDYLEKELKN